MISNSVTHVKDTTETHPLTVREILYKDLWDTFGPVRQLTIAIEELTELQKELCKLVEDFSTPESVDVAPRADAKNIAEEIADTEIMIEQVKQFLNLHSAVDQIKASKLVRTRKFLDKATSKLDPSDLLDDLGV